MGGPFFAFGHFFFVAMKAQQEKLQHWNINTKKLKIKEISAFEKNKMIIES